MDATHTARARFDETAFARLDAICARSGLDLGQVSPAIIERMRLLATVTETLRDCERSTDLAEELFREAELVKPSRERFTALERRTVVIASLFSDIGKTGPKHADAEGQRLIAEMFAVEDVLDSKMSVIQFFEAFFPADAPERIRRFDALRLAPSMTMREFWNLHSVWTLEILRGDGVPAEAVIAAAAHHLLENVNPHASIAADPRLEPYLAHGSFFARAEKLVILLDKYDAARRRGRRSHDAAIAWMRQLIEEHPKFCNDKGFYTLIDDLDAVARNCSAPEYTS